IGGVGACWWGSGHLGQVRVSPRTAGRNEQLVNVAILRAVDDLLGSSRLPLVAGEGRVGLWSRRARYLGQVRVSPRTAGRNEQLVNVAIPRDVNDLLASPCLPLVASKGAGKLWLRTARYAGQVRVTPRTSRGNEQFVNIAILCAVDDLFGSSCLPFVAGKKGEVVVL